MKVDLIKIYRSLSPNSDEQLIKYKTQFKTINDKYKYLPENDEHIAKLYIDCYTTVSSFFKDDRGIVRDPYILENYAYKMIALFSPVKSTDTEATLRNFQKYCTTFFNNIEAMGKFVPHHQHKEFLTPNAEYDKFNYNMQDIKNALKHPQIGHSALKHLDQMPQIQKINGGRLPTDKQSFEDKLLEVNFPEFQQNIDLAKLCAKSEANRGNFLTMLHLMQNGILPSYDTPGGLKLQKKLVDNLPDVNVEYINQNTGTKYNFIKLPSDDMRAMMLGSITGNCQTLGGGDANAFIIDGITKPNWGFYAIFNDRNELIGQSPAWIGRDGRSITLEAPIFIKDRCPQLDIPKIYEEFGKQLNSQGYDRVTIGIYMDNARGLKTTDNHNIPMEGQKYHFTTSGQSEIYSSERLDDIRTTIVELTKFRSVQVNPESIISVEQGDALVELIDKDKEHGDRIYKYLFSPYATTDWSQENLQTLLGKIKKLEETNDTKLGLLMSNAIKAWWYLGMTMDDIIDLPKSVIELLNSIEPLRDHDSLWEIISASELAKNIKDAQSVTDIKREMLKLADQYFSMDGGDTSYIDNFSDDQIDALSSQKNYSVYQWALRHITIRSFQFMTHDVFDFVIENGMLLHLSWTLSGKSLDDLLQEHSTLTEIKRDILSTITKIFSTSDFCNTLKLHIETLPDFVVDLLGDKKIISCILQNADIAQKFLIVLNSFSLNTSTHDFKGQVLKCIINTESDLTNMSETKLDTIISIAANALTDNVKLTDICSIETIANYTSSQLKLLFSRPAVILYKNKTTNFEELASFDLDEIKTLLAVEQYKYSEYVFNSETRTTSLATFETIAKRLCPGHYDLSPETLEVMSREQNNKIYAEEVELQKLAFLYDQYEFEF